MAGIFTDASAISAKAIPVNLYLPPSTATAAEAIVWGNWCRLRYCWNRRHRMRSAADADATVVTVDYPAAIMPPIGVVPTARTTVTVDVMRAARAADIVPTRWATVLETVGSGPGTMALGVSCSCDAEAGDEHAGGDDERLEFHKSSHGAVLAREIITRAAWHRSHRLAARLADISSVLTLFYQRRPAESENWRCLRANRVRRSGAVAR